MHLSGYLLLGLQITPFTLCMVKFQVFVTDTVKFQMAVPLSSVLGSLHVQVSPISMLSLGYAFLLQSAWDD